MPEEARPPAGDRPTQLLGRALSLERRLQLVITSLLAAILAASLVLTYHALTSAAFDSLQERLRRTSAMLARDIVASSARRNAIRQELARDPWVRDVLRADAVRPAVAESLAARMERYVASHPRRYPLELWTEDGRRVAFAGGESEAPNDPRTLPRAHPVARRGLTALQLSDSVTDGALFAIADSAFYWSVAPVRDGDIRIGWIAERTRVGGPPEAAEVLRNFIGEDVDIYVRNRADSLWVGPRGRPVPSPPARDPTTDRPAVVRLNGERAVIGESSIAGAPWIFVLASPERPVFARAMGIVGTLAGIAIVLLGVGAVAALVVGKRITRPLATLTTAAEAISAGDYTRRVRLPRTDEIGRLAASFDRMAHEVDTAHRELERRVKDAQWTAEELEQANRQLLDAMVEAEHARREAEAARAEAERANRAKSDFLAVMSHELRTPLNAIAGYTQLLELGIHGPVTPAQRDALERIKRSQAHLLRLINDVLYFARIDAAGVQYAIDAVPLEETLRSLEPLVAPQLRARHLHYDYRECDAALHVRADRDRLQQIILNLLSNAIKFTPEGGIVSVTCDATDDFVDIRVRDTGVGIPADRLESVFDPFVQVDRGPSRPSDGVGLGLAISRDLARGMGGELSLESAVGVGSVFSLRLARVPRPDRPPDADHEGHAQRGATSPSV